MYAIRGHVDRRAPGAGVHASDERVNADPSSEAQVTVEIHKPGIILPSQVADHFTVFFQLTVMHFPIGQFASEILMRNWAHEHQAQRVLFSGAALDVFHQPQIVRLELVERTAIERTGHSVSDHRHRGLDVGDLFLQLYPPLVGRFVTGLQRPQAVTGDARRRVAAPADIAKMQSLAAVLRR